MTAHAPRPGDRVRVVIEGYVDDGIDLAHMVSPPGIVLASQPPASGRTAYFQGLDPSSPLVVSVEVLPPPEPDWQPGDVARAKDGRLLVRVGGYIGGGEAYEWLVRGEIGRGVQDNAPNIRPLTPLLVGGKPVQP